MPTDSTIPGLPAATLLSLSDITYVSQSTTDKFTTLALLQDTLLGGGLASILAYSNDTGVSKIKRSAATAGRVAVWDGSKELIDSSVTNTELGMLSGMTANISSEIAGLWTVVNGLAQFYYWKDACVASTTANHSLSGLSAVDGVTIFAGNRILVRFQTNAWENGIYIANSSGWTRASDFNNGTGEKLASSIVTVQKGSLYADHRFICTTDDPITLGTDAITFVDAGGTTYSGTTNRITVAGNTIDISSSYAGQISITTVGTITNGTLGGGTNILVGSDATGDIWFNGGSGAITRSNKFKWDPSNNALCVGGNWQGWPVNFYGSASVVGIDSAGSGTHLAFIISGTVRSYIGASSTESLTVYDNTAGNLWLSVKNSDGSIKSKAITANTVSGGDVRLSDWSGYPAIYLLDTSVANSASNFAMASDGHSLYLNAIDTEVRFKVGGTTYLTVATGSVSVAGTFGSTGTASIPALVGTSAAPSISAGAGAGTSPTISIAGTNISGEITVTIGSSPGTGNTMCTVTWSGGLTYTTDSDVQLFPSNSNAVQGEVIYVNTTTTGFSIKTATGLGLTAGQQYKFKYFGKGR